MATHVRYNRYKLMLLQNRVEHHRPRRKLLSEVTSLDLKLSVSLQSRVTKRKNVRRSPIFLVKIVFSGMTGMLYPLKSEPQSKLHILVGMLSSLTFASFGGSMDELKINETRVWSLKTEKKS